MTRGRKPTPTALKRLAGNPGRRPLNEREPEPPLKAPTCPRHLDKAARAEWHRVVKLLTTQGMIAELDRAALAGYCRAWSLFVDADKHVQKYGAILISQKTGTPFQSPYLNLMTSAMKQMREFASEFGMTPSSRTRLHVAPERVESDPLFKLLQSRADRN